MNRLSKHRLRGALLTAGIVLVCFLLGCLLGGRLLAEKDPSDPAPDIEVLHYPFHCPEVCYDSHVFTSTAPG